MWIGGFLVGAAACAAFFRDFHSFGLYIHNDTMNAIGLVLGQLLGSFLVASFVAVRQVMLLPAPWIQHFHINTLGAAMSAPVQNRMLFPANQLLVHHGIALGLHISVLILLKAVLTTLSFEIFIANWPRREGTCSVLAWDHIILGLFWLYNSISIVIFHFS